MESKKLKDIQKLVQRSLAEIENNPHQSDSMKLGFIKQSLVFIENIIDHGNVYGDEAEQAQLSNQQQIVTPAFYLKPCSHCGSTDLVRNKWALIDNQETVAIECNQCKAGSPLLSWNKRVAS